MLPSPRHTPGLLIALALAGAPRMAEAQPARPQQGPGAQRPATAAAAPAQPTTAQTGPAQAVTPPPPQNPTPASATDPTLQEARRAYDEGGTHYVAGRYVEALIAFERAYSLRPNPVVLLPILECHDHLGHVPEAIRTLESYLQAVPEARNRPLLEARLNNLRRRPARVHVITTPPGARLLVDGRAVADATPTYVELPAGRHTVSASLRGFQTSSHDFETQPGTARDEILLLEPDPAAQNPPERVGPDPVVPTTATPRGTSPVVWVSAGLAGAALVAGTTFGILALSDNNLYDTNPTRETRDRGLRYALISDVSFGVAAAGAVFAAVVYFVDRSRSSETRAPEAPAPRRTSLQVLPGALRVDF